MSDIFKVLDLKSIALFYFKDRRANGGFSISQQ